MMTRPYSLLAEPRDQDYRSLLAWAPAICRSFILVVRDGAPLDESGQAVLKALRPLLLVARSADEWPGTRLLEGTALVLEHSLTDAAVDILARATDGLYSWLQPGLPEDLCLLRANGKPWLVTIAHERDGYLLLSPSEREALQARLPRIRLPERPDSGP